MTNEYRTLPVRMWVKMTPDTKAIAEGIRNTLGLPVTQDSVEATYRSMSDGQTLKEGEDYFTVDSITTTARENSFGPGPDRAILQRALDVARTIRENYHGKNAKRSR